MRTSIAAALTTLALAASTMAGATTATAQPDTAPRAAKKVATQFALGATGFGTRVQGGDLPTASDATAYQAIGCTNIAGNTRTNTEAQVTVPGLGVLNGVRTRVWTQKRGNVVSSYATHSIAKLTIADTPLGSLEIRGIRSMSRAFHKNGKFHAATSGEVARIVLQPAGGLPAQSLPIPTPDQPLTVPGLATIKVGGVSKKVNRDGARAAANVLQIDVVPTDTTARVAQSVARISGGIKRGVFRGYSDAVNARGLGDNVRVGRTPLSLMPCQGTKGKAQVKQIAGLDLADQIVVSGIASGQVGKQTNRRTFGTERGQVAQISLADGALVINGIVGQATVSRTKKGVTRSARGTTVGSVVANGETYTFPKTGKLEIPGLASLEAGITRRINNGLKVVGLRIKLLDGNGAVVDLGTAQLKIGPGPIKG